MWSTSGSPVPPTLLPTSAVMRAMRLGRMAPHSTFLLKLGFLGSFRLLILLRTRLRYFMSVLFSSWKICWGGSVKESRGQGGGMPAPWAPTAALDSVVLIVTRASAHMHVEVADPNRAFFPGRPCVGGSHPLWAQ